MKEKNIVFETETETFYVYKIKDGVYEIYKNGLTHATRVATVSYPFEPEKGLQRAIEICKEKESIFNLLSCK